MWYHLLISDLESLRLVPHRPNSFHQNFSSVLSGLPSYFWLSYPITSCPRFSRSSSLLRDYRRLYSLFHLWIFTGSLNYCTSNNLWNHSRQKQVLVKLHPSLHSPFHVCTFVFQIYQPRLILTTSLHWPSTPQISSNPIQKKKKKINPIDKLVNF